MASSNDDAEKSHEPSQRKLEQARRKGDIARSNDVLTAMSYFGLFATCLLFGRELLLDYGNLFVGFVDLPDLFDVTGADQRKKVISWAIVQGVLTTSLSIFFIPFSLVCIALLATRSIVFAPSKLEPKISKISILQNAKNKFGAKGLFEFLKSFAKLVIYAIILFTFLYGNMDRIIHLPHLSSSEVVSAMTGLIVDMLLYVVVVSFIIGVVDYSWQYAEHLRQNRMTHKEVRDEHKDAEGDPHIKQQRRARGMDLINGNISEEVPKSDVVVVNPTHYAVALTWSKEKHSAPVCVAKGVNAVALNIRNIASEHKVPIHHDPPTARALYATVDVGHEIQPEHYRPVAAAIRFAEVMRRRQRSVGG